jgi:flagellar basal-body rod modification protein FlgD
MTLQTSGLQMLPQAMTAKQTATTAAAGASTGSTSSSSADSGADVTSADFLTLLVSELKNQDPTQPTDPTAYVQQLVSVNSLQQLISINQDLGGSSSSGSGSGSGTGSGTSTTGV